MSWCIPITDQNSIISTTPYVDLTPAQYTDLTHSIHEYVAVCPDYRTVQQCTPETVLATGTDETDELPAPQNVTEDSSTNLLGLKNDGT